MAPRFGGLMQATAKVCMDHQVPLFLVIHSAAEVDLVYLHHLARPGEKALLLRRADWLRSTTTDWMATYLANPKAMVHELMLIVDRIKEIDEDSIIMVNAAGRAGII